MAGLDSENENVLPGNLLKPQTMATVFCRFSLSGTSMIVWYSIVHMSPEE